MTTDYTDAQQRLIHFCLQRASMEFGIPDANSEAHAEFLDGEIHTAAQRLVRLGLRHSRLAGPHPSEPSFKPTPMGPDPMDPNFVPPEVGEIENSEAQLSEHQGLIDDINFVKRDLIDNDVLDAEAAERQGEIHPVRSPRQGHRHGRLGPIS